MPDFIPISEEMEIVWAGRAVIRRGMRNSGIPALQNLPQAGSYWGILLCEGGGGLYFDPRIPRDRQ